MPQWVAMEPLSELGRFLRACRDRVSPDGAPVILAGERRVPGLRREEVAVMAGVSVDYYIRLEQGRVRPSDPVLESISRALQLDATETAHLWTLARHADGLAGTAPVSRMVPGTERLLELVSPVPAVLMDHCCEVLAWNATGAALDEVLSSAPPGGRNVARRVFLNPTSGDFYPEWDALAQEIAYLLRLNANRFAEDARLEALVRELISESPAFRKLWDHNRVTDKTRGRKVLAHPRVGQLELIYEAFAIPDAPGQMLVIYMTEPGSSSEGALERLQRLAAGPTTAQMAPAGF
jgi:transcriptional regulator with XRE-family HTH domain